MESSNYSKWTALLLTGALTFTLSAPALGASVQAVQTKPSWTSSSLFTPTVLVKKDAEAVIYDVKAVPGKKLVYVHMGQDVPNTTGKTKQEWSVDTLKALDTDTGKLKWEYVFHDSKGPYTTLSSAVVSSNGTAYVYQAYSDKTYKLYSVNSSGKLNWVQTLAGASKISLMKDGTILAAATGTVDSKGVIKTTLTSYDSSGKAIHRQQVQGVVVTAQGDRIVLAADPLSKTSEGAWLDKLNPRLEVYDLSFKQLYAYQTPAGANIYGEGSPGQFVLQDGTFILRIHVNGTQNKLLALDPAGKLLWGRNIPGSSITQATTNGYVVYDKGKLTLYGLDGSQTTRTFEEGEGEFTQITVTGDSNLSINLKDNSYILNPATLAVIHAFDNGSLNLITNDYAAHTVYSSSKDGKLSKIVLPVK